MFVCNFFKFLLSSVGFHYIFFPERDKLILSQLQATKSDVVEKLVCIENKIDTLMANIGHEHKENDYSELLMFNKCPLKTQEEFDLLENNLDDASFSRKFVSIMILLSI